MMESRALQSLQDLLAGIDAEAATARDIERFLRGESDGGALFRALYGATADEPVPERLLAVLREGNDTAPPPARAAAS